MSAEIEGRKLYVAWVDSQDIHPNRFKSWNELTKEDREEWMAKVPTDALLAGLKRLKVGFRNDSWSGGMNFMSAWEDPDGSYYRADDVDRILARLSRGESNG